ncbi:methyl-accepting chemotaxis protein [Pseudoduganella armeniaca]|uniref:Methyl-accepting chemotaxis protein n=1 Tax=Pseudoduganella armeniaca TaxID=2072590 RepID=A0A2R4CB20_9BURK|nr:methyl-accepting chemotaxis protein [Pseudoduganella armeniaca]AVR96803.1 methyl-accepting chemotaxis protein [Pseudoduganella armeniaca]
MLSKTSTRLRYTVAACAFFALTLIGTFTVMQLFVAPDLAALEGRLVIDQAAEIGTRVSEQLRKVEAQQRSITQTVALLDSEQIDRLQPGLVDQYGDPNVFGGGIWPLPNKREQGREKFSTFFARDAATRQLVVNTHWNSPESLKYWEQPWYENGKTAAKGHCNWAKAYQDDASPQPRTNCAMPIYKGAELYGVSTIDVTLGFFNTLVADMEKKLGAQILIVEGDGKIVSNSTRIDGNIVLKNVGDLAASSPMAAEIKVLLDKARNGEPVEGSYQTPQGRHTLFLRAIPGSPWFIATGIPTSMLATNSDRIMFKLAAIQVPMGVLLLVAVVSALGVFMRRLGTLKASIDELGAGEGDLTRRLPETGGLEFAGVARSFNTFIAQLQDIVRQVATGSASISAASEEISSGNRDLSARTEDQAASLEETAASMEEITGTVKQTADNADRANRLASQASDVATRGGNVIGDVVAKMNAISDASKKIVDITGVIDGIAFQTNILALNAAVEAARAGEQGRGFAVVAGEVRNLAQRAASAAKEIKALIDDSNTQVNAGAELVGQAGATMSEIIATTENVATIVNEIVSAAREQSSGIEQINQTITQLDASTQQNAALVEQVAASAEAMQQQAQVLNGVVGAFRL